MQMSAGFAVEPSLSRSGLLRFKLKATENEFRDFYSLQNTVFYAFAALLGAVLYYVFFLWDDIIDPIHSPTAHIVRGVLFPLVAVLIAGLILLPTTKQRSELWITVLCFAGHCGLAYIYYILKNGYEFGAVGFVLIFLWQANLLRLRLIYNLVGTGSAIAAMNIGMAFSLEPNSGFWIVNNLAVVTGAFLAVIGAAYREHTARENFTLERALASARTKVGDLEYSLERARGPISGKRVFISYRRSDSEAISGRIRDRLAAHFGPNNIFMDIDSIPIGVDYRDHVRSVIARSNVVVAVMGRDWAGHRQDGGKRIAEQTDPVGRELEIAFEDGVQVMPVLVDGAIMPASGSLPSGLQRISYLNAASVSSGRDFHMHLDRFIKALEDAPPEGR